VGDMKKILIIDDDPDIRELVGNRLKKNGFTIRTAQDGVEGMAMIKDYSPDLVIMDVMMPHLDGYSLLQELKFNLDLNGIPVMVLTARKDLKDIFDHMGKVCFMTKPFNPKTLVSSVKQCMVH
jgi:DNA-binding response OmpR family regulator